ncbi:MAG: hypothetical protein IJV40_03555 [Oscillospiraceae bacterium]|nr:hypothetical protein [Oscillospiraceae bacterium]
MAEVKEKMVKIRLPLTKYEKDDVFVRVNQRTWLIKRGVEVEVPECVVEVLNHAEEQKLAGIEFQEKAQKKTD